MSIKQFSGTYYLNDDRIMFRFNTADSSEYRFWLTRRVTHCILKASNQFLAERFQKKPSSIEKVLSEIQPQPGSSSPSFSKAYEPGTQYPIGSDAILVMNVKCEEIQTEETPIFSLDFVLPGGANLNLKLPITTMSALNMLLEDLNIQANWGYA